MKKIFGTLLTLVLVLGLSIPINVFAKNQNNSSILTGNLIQNEPKVYNNGDSIELKKGQKVRVLFGNQKDKTRGYQTNGIITDLGDGSGWVDITRYSTYLTYNIFITKTYTSISGTAELRDIKMGTALGFFPVSTNVGEVTYMPAYGHQFAFTISGYAYVLTVPKIIIYARVYWNN